MTFPKFYIQHNPEDIWRDSVEIRFAYRDREGKLFVAQPLVMQQVTEEQCTPSLPMMSLCVKGDNAGTLQDLMNQLWAMGIRPEDIGTPGHLAATTKHLEDMRAIAFKGLEIEKPKA